MLWTVEKNQLLPICSRISESMGFAALGTIFLQVPDLSSLPPTFLVVEFEYSTVQARQASYCWAMTLPPTHTPSFPSFHAFSSIVSSGLGTMVEHVSVSRILASMPSPVSASIF